MRRLQVFLSHTKLRPLFFILLIIIQLSITLLTLGIVQSINQSINLAQNHQNSEIYGVLLIGVFCILLHMAFTYYGNRYIGEQQLKSGQMLQEELLSKTIRMEKKQMHSVTSGDLLTKVTQVSSDMISFWFQSIFLLSQGGLIVVFSILYMAYLNIWMALGIVLYNILLYVAMPFFTRKIQKENKRLIDLRSQSNTNVVEFLQNFLLIKVWNVFDYFSNRIERNEIQIQKSAFLSFAWENGTSEIIWTTKKIIPEIILVFGLGAVLLSRGMIEYGNIAALIMASDIFGKGILSFSDGLISYGKAKPNQDTVVEYMNRREHDLYGQIIPAQEGIQLKNISFSFGERTILRDTSLSIQPGDKVLIRGGNGQGKSTLLNILIGLYPVDSGEVLIPQRFEKMVYIPQNPHIFGCSLSQNIQLDSKRIPDSLQLKRVNLFKAMEENPETFSTGEQQRVIIARGMHHGDEAELILCDEIFSNIDKANAELIVEQIISLWRDKTVIMVCHEMIEYPFNKQIIIEDGSVSMESFPQIGGESA